MPEVVAIQFDEVEGVEKHAVVRAVVTDPPFSSQATASPSTMQDRKCRRATVSTINGNR
jgi:hypothetical protein